MLLHISISAGITADLFAVFFRDNLSFLSPGKRKLKSAGYGFLWSVHQGSVFSFKYRKCLCNYTICIYFCPYFPNRLYKKYTLIHKYVTRQPVICTIERIKRPCIAAEPFVIVVILVFRDQLEHDAGETGAFSLFFPERKGSSSPLCFI